MPFIATYHSCIYTIHCNVPLTVMYHIFSGSKQEQPYRSAFTISRFLHVVIIDCRELKERQRNDLHWNNVHKMIQENWPMDEKFTWTEERHTDVMMIFVCECKVKIRLSFSLPQGYIGVAELQIQLLTSDICGGEWPASRPGRFASGKRSAFPLH